MKKYRILIIAACVAVVASLALVGCFGGKGKADAAWVGNYKLVEMAENGEVTGADDLATLEALGLTVTLSMNEDHTAVLDMFGETMSGTWEAKSTSAGTLTMQNQKIDLSLSNGRLTMSQNGTSLTFQKI